MAARLTETTEDGTRKRYEEQIIQLTGGAGLIAGFIAGVAMSIAAMFVDALIGKGIWATPQLIGTILLGAPAYPGPNQLNLPLLVVGTVLHEATSAVMGFVYALLLQYSAFARHPLITALLYVLVAWAVFQYLMMPWMAPAMQQHIAPLELAAAHIVFGFALAGFAIWRATGQG